VQTVSYPKSGDVLSEVLDRDLRNAGIPIVGIAWSAGNVRVDYGDEATPAQMAQGEAIVAAHVPVDPIQQVADGAESAVNAIPGWAHWTAAEANTWGQTNIGQPLTQARIDLAAMSTLSLATFKVAMGKILDILDKMWTLQQALGQMVIALRNKEWPNLQN
jgi:hypothetical protein